MTAIDQQNVHANSKPIIPIVDNNYQIRTLSIIHYYIIIN